MALIDEEQVVLDLTAPDRHDATRQLAQTLVASGRCTDLETFLADVRAREEKMATGLPGGIGIPHARSAAITEPSLVFGRPRDGIDWGAKDGPATTVFLIAAPEAGGDAHMQMLPKLARALMKKDFRAALAGATTPAEIVAIVNTEVSLDPAPANSPADANTPATKAGASAGDTAHRVAGATDSVPATGGTAPAAVPAGTTSDTTRGLRLVGVTSCPTGIAHTYMAAESLENAAKAAGHTMHVETQGSAGATPLSAQQIAEADAVIFAHDLEVKDKVRFAGKPTVDVGVKRGISDGPQLIAQAEQLVKEWQADPSKAAAAASAGSAGGLTTKVDQQASTATELQSGKPH